MTVQQSCIDIQLTYVGCAANTLFPQVRTLQGQREFGWLVTVFLLEWRELSWEQVTLNLLHALASQPGQQEKSVRRLNGPS